MAERTFVVIICRAWINETGYGLHYYLRSDPLPTVKAAIRAGLKSERCDDFNIGVLDDGRLVDVLWMEESIGNDPDDLAEIESELG